MRLGWGGTCASPRARSDSTTIATGLDLPCEARRGSPFPIPPPVQAASRMEMSMALRDLKFGPSCRRKDLRYRTMYIGAPSHIVCYYNPTAGPWL
jgi:hypothetical protein